MPPTDARQHANAPMTPLEKALAWHTLGKAWSPNAPSVHHVDAIVAELERVKAERPAPDPALVERIRRAYEGALQRRFIVVGLELADVEQLLAHLSAGRTRQETDRNG